MHVPLNQQAAIVPKQKAALEIIDRPVPIPEKDQVLVKILFTGINLVDAKIRDYHFIIPEYPAILGSDAAGQIVAIGEGSSSSSSFEFKVNDRVFFQGNYMSLDTATFQQYAIVPIDLLGLTPNDISDEEASSISVCGLAASIGLYHPSGYGLTPLPWEKDANTAGKGQSIVILGGSSSVGQYVIQLAKISVYDCIITASSSQHKEYLLSIGATIVLDRHEAKVKDYINAIGGSSLSIVYDSISSNATQMMAVEILQAKHQIDMNKTVIVTTLVDPKVKEVAAKGQEPITLKAILAAGSLPHLRQFASKFYEEIGGKDGWLAKKIIIPSKVKVVQGGLYEINKSSSID